MTEAQESSCDLRERFIVHLPCGTSACDVADLTTILFDVMEC
jgi:hypothetical protein